ncbi:MAG: PAS domain S-box protein [bacterium]|nr:PAS domain S-box protein [bacterium]
MLKSLRARMLAAVSAVLLVTTFSAMFLAQKETEKAMFSAQDNNACNLVSTLALTIEQQYAGILAHKTATLESRKTEAKNITLLAVSYIDSFHQKYKAGLLSEAAARKGALEKVKTLRYNDNTGYMWINDTGRPFPRMMMHASIPDLDGKLLDAPRFNCALGIKKNLFQAFVDVCLEHGEGYVDYLWPKPTRAGLTPRQAKLSYVHIYKEWDWVVGTGFYIDDIESESRRQLNSFLDDLKQTFSKIRIAESGYLFVFNGQKESLVHPMVKGDAANIKNPLSGNYLLDELMAAAESSVGYFDYTWNKPPEFKDQFQFRKRAYMVYCHDLDWYVGASVYVDEIEAPGKIVRSKVFWFSLVLLVPAFILVGLLVGSLTRPLQKLTTGAGEVERVGIGAAGMDIHIPVGGTIETQKLGTVLEKMIQSTRDALLEKQRLLGELENNYSSLSKANRQLQREISDRKDAEETLQKLRHLLSNVIDSMPSMLMGIDSGELINLWNLEAEKITGITAILAHGRNPVELIPQFVCEMELVRRAGRTRAPIKKTKVPFRINGQSRFADVTVYPVFSESDSKQVEGAVIRIDDVTEQVRIDGMMIQSEKMMSVGGLAAGMAHEINNPLAGILQNIQVISNRLQDGNPKNERTAKECGTSMQTIWNYMEKRNVFHMFDSIVESGKRAAQIVSNVLEFSRKDEANQVPHDLADLMEKTIMLAGNDYDLKNQNRFNDIDISREYAAHMPKVRCEAAKIQQVLLNLLKNGARAMTGEDSQKEHPLFTLRLMPDPESGWARLEVEDNGPGMDQDQRKRVFEPFYSTKNVGVGTGLGLAVSYFIIAESHGGTMTVESSPGRGSNFIVRLPLEGSAR